MYQKSNLNSPFHHFLFVVDSKVKKVDHLCVINATSAPFFVTNKGKGSCEVPRKQLIVYNASKGPKGKYYFTIYQSRTVMNDFRG